MPLTFFVAHLTCPNCGTVSPDDTSTEMQSHLSRDRGITILHVGDKPDVSIGDMEASYITLRKPKSGEPVRILEHWICPTCQHSNWAEIVFENGTITKIEGVALTRPAFERANFVSEDIYQVYWDLVGSSLYEEGKVIPGFAQRLIEKLPG